MPSPPFDAATVAGFLQAASGAEQVEISEPTLLSGGAIQENWAFTALFDGGRLAGSHALVLRTDAATGVPSSLSRPEEFVVLRAAFLHGVTVPEPLFVCDDPYLIDRPFFVMRRVAGTAQGRQITADPRLEPELPGIAARLGQELARLQTIAPSPELCFLRSVGAAEHIAGFRAYLDGHPNPRPVLEWAIRWLETHMPEPLAPVLCHRDFRTGNYMLDGARLTAILDWEFAGWGDPDEDIGWLCCKGWRFARLDREAGGIADRATFYGGYEAASGRRLDPQRVHFWEVLANVRWAIIALQQSDRHLIGGARDLATAIIGRRATECDLELLILLDPERPCFEVPNAAQPIPLRDRPDGAGLLQLARELLLDELAPLLPAERQRDLHLAATAMAIAEREVVAADAPARMALAALRDFYDHREAGEATLPRMLRRMAADLRVGAFESCAARARGARAILWRLTMAKLREGNPAFLAANGFGD